MVFIEYLSMMGRWNDVGIDVVRGLDADPRHHADLRVPRPPVRKKSIACFGSLRQVVLWWLERMVRAEHKIILADGKWN
jgi:hypothetical protein